MKPATAEALDFAATRAAALAPVRLYERLIEQERRLTAAGWPALSPWWLDVLRRFYAGGYQELVARVGRRGLKSSTICRVAVNELLHGRFYLPPGEIGVWPFFSSSTGEADDRLATIAALLDTLGVGHDESTDRRGHFIALRHRPLVFRVLAARFRTGVGFLGVGVTYDELARWHDERASANPASHVLASVNPSMANQPTAHRFLLSSPWSTLDAHAKAVEAGTTADRLVVEAPTWIANPTLIEAELRRLEADPMTFAREYGAIPMPAGAILFFDPEAVRAAMARPTTTAQPGDQIVAGADLGFRRDASALVVAALRGGAVHELERLELRPEPGHPLRPSDVVARMGAVLARHHCPAVMADAHYRESLLEYLEPYGVEVIDAPLDVPATYVHFRTLLHQGRLSLLPSDRVAAALERISSAPTATGRVRISLPRDADGGHADVVSALVLACWQRGGVEIVDPRRPSTLEVLEQREAEYRRQLCQRQDDDDGSDDDFDRWAQDEEDR